MISGSSERRFFFRILLVIGLILFFLTIFLNGNYIYSQWEKQQIQIKIFSEMLSNDFILSEHHLKEDLALILEDRELVTAFANHQISNLKKISTNHFKTLKREHHYLEKLQFFLPDNRLIFQIPQQKIKVASSSVQSPSVQGRVDLDKVYSGFEIGADGFFYKMARSILFNNQIIGTVKISVRVEYLLAILERHGTTKGLIAVRQEKGFQSNEESNIRIGNFVLHFSDIQSKRTIHEISKKFDKIENIFTAYIEHKFIAFHKFPLKNFNGQTVGIIAILQDITSLHNRFLVSSSLSLLLSFMMYTAIILLLYYFLRNIFFNLTEQRIKIELILTSVGEGILGQDLSGNTMCMNPAVTEITGWTKRDLVGRHHHHLLHHSHADGTVNSIENCKIAHAKNFDKVYRVDDEVFWKKDGSFIPVEYLATPMKNELGEMIGAVIAFTDISERVRLHQELKAAKDKAEYAAQAKGRFLANMSHEIRTPLHCILGILELVLHEQSSEEIAKKIKLATSSSQHLLGLINDILDYSKYESNAIVLKEELFYLHQLVQEVIAELRIGNFYDSQKNISINFNIDADIPERLLGDAAKIRQILFNLVGNAIKFTIEGTVDLRIFMEKGSSGNSDVFLRFEIEDTGVGIPAELKDRLFRSFEQLENPLQSQMLRKGTGLGLAISRLLVERIGGQIWLEQSSSHGSTFIFTLALQQPAAIVPTEEKQKIKSIKCPENIRKMKFLLAEDNIVNQQVAKAMFDHLGLDLQIVSNGQEALHYLESSNGSIAALFMDVEMPVMNGIEATAGIRNDSSGKNHRDIPIIACTAHIYDENRQKFIDSGMTDCLFKPFSVQDICEILVTLFPEDRYDLDKKVQNG